MRTTLYNVEMIIVLELILT